MKKLKILSSATGRIKTLLFQSGQQHDQNVDEAMMSFKKTLTQLTKNRTADFKIWFIGARDFDTDDDAVDPTDFHSLAISFLKNASNSGIKDQIVMLEPDFDMETFQEEWQPSGLFATGRTIDFNGLDDWIQDPFLVMRGAENTPVLLEPYYSWFHTSSNDCNAGEGPAEALMSKFIPEMLSSQTHVLMKSTPFYFQGGNILADGNIALIGSDIVKKNLRAYKSTFKTVPEFLKAFAVTLGVEEVICPGLPSHIMSSPLIDCQNTSLYHIDLWLTMGGVRPRGRLLVFVGQIYGLGVSGWKPKTAAEDPREQYLTDAANRLAGYKNDRGKLRFEVVRLPLPVDKDGYLFSYNNCIVEVDGDFKQVFMQVFAEYPDGVDRPAKAGDVFAGVDELATNAFKKCGFEVRKIDLGLSFAKAGKAGLHCLSLVVERH